MNISSCKWILLCLVLIFCQVSFAKKNDFKKVIKPSPKQLITVDQDREIARTQFDFFIDRLIEERYGEDFRRTNIYDLYPLEIPKNKSIGLSSKEEIELMDYYIYARKNLEKISKSKLLKVEKADYDQDGDFEYAVILSSKRHKNHYLAICSKSESLYLERFKADFVELVNSGKFPTGIFDDTKLRTLKSPTLRIIDFGEYNHILYYDRDKESWVDEEVRE